MNENEKARKNEISTKAFRDTVVNQINACMNKDAGDGKKYTDLYKGPCPQASLKFVDVLGSSKDPHWWRLYINPVDWPWAWRNNSADPGLVYDGDQSTSKGFQSAMVAVYNKYLVGDTLGKAVAESDYGWTKYLELHSDATDKVGTTIGDGSNTGPNRDHYYARLPDQNGTFPTNHDTASDAGEKLNGKYLIKVYSRDPTFPNTDKEALANHYINMDLGRLYCCLPPDVTIGNVDAAFKEFKANIGNAKTCKARLELIAQLIRRLHVIHAFNDGSGRTNVFLLLPALLLHFGFGLPLGAKNELDLDNRALDQLFNGGYTVDEIAKYLFVVQDRGLLEQQSTSILRAPVQH